MSTRPLSNIDLAWLRMDKPNALMIITGVMVFGSPLDIERLKTTVENSLMRFNRFRQRVVQPGLPMRPYWEDDPDFDLNAHLQLVSLPPQADQAALEELISELMSTELDPSLPLWKFYIIEKYGEGSALIYRFHHCFADGTALIQVLLSMTDAAPDTPGQVTQAESPAVPEQGPSEVRYRREKLSSEIASRVGIKLVEVGNRILEEHASIREYARMGASTAVAAGRLALRWPDPLTLFKGTLGRKKVAVWSDPLSLDEVKDIGRAFGGTVNDVLLSFITGALRRYMQARGESVDEVDLRGVIPVNLRQIELDDELGNDFGLVFLTLPVGTAEPLPRLYQLKRNMDDLKSSPEAVAAYGLLNVFGVIPPRLQDVVVSIFDTKGSLVISNVPGPKEQLYLAGAPIDSIMAWVPQAGSLGLGVSIISYFGKVWLGVAADQGLVPDPERIIEFFFDEFFEMKSMAQTALAKQPEPIAPMLSQLDKTLRTLDEILDASKRADETIQDARPPRCLGRTKSGRQCRNRALPGRDYCRVHLE